MEKLGYLQIVGIKVGIFNIFHGKSKGWDLVTLLTLYECLDVSWVATKKSSPFAVTALKVTFAKTESKHLFIRYKHVPNDEIVAEGVVERSLARNRIYMVFCNFQTISMT